MTPIPRVPSPKTNETLDKQELQGLNQSGRPMLLLVVYASANTQQTGPVVQMAGM